MKKPSQITVALRMPNGKAHVMNGTPPYTEVVEEAKAWAQKQYGEAPRVVLCEVEKGSKLELVGCDDNVESNGAA